MKRLHLSPNHDTCIRCEFIVLEAEFYTTNEDQWEKAQNNCEKMKSESKSLPSLQHEQRLGLKNV